ncbi:MAG TPA: sulfotransferase [Steroidobacteraceae bacterium]|nr:sulfotransferase [Steroidobacteraceae bacterium]
MSSPSDPAALVNLARQDLAGGQIAAAEEKCMRVLGAHHQHPGALDVLGMVLSSQGRYEEAVRVFNALTLMQPTLAAHWQNLGTVLRPAGRPAQSLAAFERALRLGPPTAGLLYNLGALQMDRLDYRAAHLALRDAVVLAPRDARIRWTYAQCCYDIGHQQEAVTALEDWETLDGLSVEITVSIALLLLTSGAAHLARPALQRLSANPPATGRAAVGFAFLLERLHRLDEARGVLEQLALNDGSLSADSERLAMSAVLADRDGRHEDAHRQLTAALAKQQESAHRYNLLYPLAKACDALGRYEEAYAAAAEAHRSQLAFLERATGKASEAQSQLWALTANECDPDDIALWERAGNGMEGSPVFIVGFPRSGTTLLEQTLDAHPLLQSMDEQPFLLQAVARVTDQGIRYPTELGKLNGSDLNDIRAHYWAAVRSRVPLAPDQRLVDKNPMNMVLLPIIRRLFPDASVILAVRHPCDTVVSCFLQDFRSDLAFLGRDLTSLARAYSRAFGFWYSQWPLLQTRTHELKYEQLTADFAAELDRLCAFLQLPRHEAMLAPGEHARAKGFISTPSYAQVIEPVNARSVGRWKHYERYFSSEALTLLAPWIERWGYSL